MMHDSAFQQPASHRRHDLACRAAVRLEVVELGPGADATHRRWISGWKVATVVAVLCSAINALAAEPRLLLHKPTVSASQIAFEYAAELWIVEVELDPKEVRAGKDPQLAKAIEIVLGELAKHPVKHPAHPPYPNYYKPGLKEPAEGR
jgi:hypothetical protein